MRGRVRLLGAALGWILLAALASAEPSFLIRSWQTGEGLPHNAPTMVRQAPDGYLWIATNAGVSRFDGMRFENFGVRDGLPTGQVLSLFVDSRSRVWAGTAAGVVVWEAGAWHVPDGLPEQGQVWCIGEAPDGSLLIGTDRGMLRVPTVGQATWVSGLPDPNVRDFEVDRDGSVWVVCRSGLVAWRGDGVHRVAALEQAVRGREMWGMAPMPDGRWVVFGRDLLLAGAGDSWVDESASIPTRGGIHNSAVMGQDGSLWVGTRNGGVSRRKDGKWTELDASSGLSHDDVRDLHVDAEGGLWVCTNGGGINLVRQRWFDVFGLAEGLGRHVTTALACDGAGRILAGTDGGGVRVFNGRRFEGAITPPALTDPFVWSLSAQPSGELWIGTFREGVLRWKDGPIGPPSHEIGLEDGWIPVQMRDRKGVVWVGARSGAVYRFVGGRFELVRPAGRDRVAAVTALLEDRSGTIWMATAGEGLWRFRSERWEPCGREQGLEATGVMALCEDRAGRLWVGTSGLGLAMFEGDRCSTWHTRQGIACDSVLQILDDDRGNLWLGTDLGLQRVVVDDLLEVAAGKRERLQATDVFGRADGLVSPQFSSGHGNLTARSPEGDLWFSLAAGALRVRPEAHGAATPPLTPRIESVTAGSDAVWQHEWTQPRGKRSAQAGNAPVRGVVLDSPVAPLEFRFSAPSFMAPEKLRFRYRLVGLDGVWRDVGAMRTVTFTSLPPGRFRFEVMAARPGAPWTGPAVALPLEVRPRFWQVWWFLALALVAGACLVGIAVRWWSLRRLRRRMEVLEQERKIEGERTRIAQDLHDDLGATLTEINFLGVLGAAGATSPETRKRLEGIVERAQRMAKSLDEIVWTVNPTNDSLASTISYLCSRTQESVAAGGLRCRLDVAEGMPAAVLDSEVRHHLLMVVNQAVHNAMKHAEARELRLVVRQHGELLAIAVEDDGVGFDPAAVPVGRHGLGNMRRRMEAVGGSCRVESRVGGGTRVHFELPLPGRGRTRPGDSPLTGGSA